MRIYHFVVVFLTGLILGFLISDNFFSHSMSVETPTPLSKHEDAKGVRYYSNLENGFRVSGISSESTGYSGPIINSSYLTYSEYFERAYGYPKKFTSTSLPEYLDFIEYDVRYAGDYQRCRLKLLIDNDGPVELIPETVGQLFFGGSLEKFPSALPRKVTSHLEKEYQREFRLQQSGYARFGEAALNQYHLIGVGMPNEPEARASISLVVMSSRPDIYKEWTLIEVALSCSELTRNIFQHNEVFLALPPSISGEEDARFFPDVGRRLITPVPKQIVDFANKTLNLIKF